MSDNYGGKFRGDTLSTQAANVVLAGNYLPAHDEVFDLAQHIGVNLGTLHAYIRKVRSVTQADNAVRELLNGFLTATADSDLDWTYEGPDPEVGIFGEAMYHDPCQPHDGDPVEADEQQADVQDRDEHTVAITRIWKCPACGKTYESVSFEPREHMEADLPGGDE